MQFLKDGVQTVVGEAVLLSMCAWCSRVGF